MAIQMTVSDIIRAPIGGLLECDVLVKFCSIW